MAGPWLPGQTRRLDGRKDDYVAGPPEKRAEDLNALFADPEVDVIQVLWGGTGAIEILPYLDYDRSPRTRRR